ncbi:hypothetical protein ABZ621_24610 [Streptomyces sp. NPDC007863]|uniref:hypothetical protein n=1 Tax=Streptomyces sp. NPDC007863 TaxID=3154894 RepID=UPI0033C0AB17
MHDARQPPGVRVVRLPAARGLPVRGLTVRSLAAWGLTVRSLAAWGLPVRSLAAWGLPVRGGGGVLGVPCVPAGAVHRLASFAGRARWRALAGPR